MNIGVFAFILTMSRDGKPVTDIDSLRQYSKAEPLRALALLVLMFSLAGVPPLGGLLWQILCADGPRSNAGHDMACGGRCRWHP
jgi:NADH:ubiquinone oxidoreductase subunit 2 (subunit N)